MMNCANDCGAMSYYGYGCFCGFGGSGVPVDKIDTCCKEHDDCYERQMNPWFIYCKHYEWTCSKNRLPVCDFKNDPYKQQLCECDLEFALCISKHKCPKTRATCKSGYDRLTSLPKIDEKNIKCEQNETYQNQQQDYHYQQAKSPNQQQVVFLPPY
ncbi:basic phospholipase A2 PA-5-like [Leptopilina boulardi]|uniref:basic phospholipase A2 PA-5-like n=1 Tax=Leptopilina boulardi TaxID=63433 RepID=UPI0021F5E68B|nr:basic phospholipase A2 PA-5-like [Leptopilina boulardi]